MCRVCGKVVDRVSATKMCADCSTKRYHEWIDAVRSKDMNNPLYAEWYKKRFGKKEKGGGKKDAKAN